MRSSGAGSRSTGGLFNKRGFFARSVRGGFVAGKRTGREVPFQPFKRCAEVDTSQVHHQVDRPAAALATAPVRELGAGDRQGALFGVPFGLVVPIPLRPAERQHGLQRHRPDRGGAPAELVEVHSASLSSPSSSLGRKLWQFFMLITWLVSVSRLSKARG